MASSCNKGSFWFSERGQVCDCFIFKSRVRISCSYFLRYFRFGNNSDNGGNFRPWDGRQGERNFDRGGTGERSFDRGGAGERSFDRGGRDFQNNFDSNSNDNFNRSEKYAFYHLQLNCICLVAEE